MMEPLGPIPDTESARAEWAAIQAVRLLPEPDAIHDGNNAAHWIIKGRPILSTLLRIYGARVLHRGEAVTASAIRAAIRDDLANLPDNGTPAHQRIADRWAGEAIAAGMPKMAYNPLKGLSRLHEGEAGPLLSTVVNALERAVERENNIEERKQQNDREFAAARGKAFFFLRQLRIRAMSGDLTPKSAAIIQGETHSVITYLEVLASEVIDHGGIKPGDYDAPRLAPKSKV